MSYAEFVSHVNTQPEVSGVSPTNDATLPTQTTHLVSGITVRVDWTVVPSQAQKDQLDADIAGTSYATWLAEHGGDPVQTNRRLAREDVDQVSGDGVRVRALIELFNKRDNYLVSRITELQSAMNAMKASSGPADNIRNAIPASWLPTATRPKSAAVQDYKDDINAGNQDT